VILQKRAGMSSFSDAAATNIEVLNGYERLKNSDDVLIVLNTLKTSILN